MKASGVISLGMVAPTELRKSAGAGRAGILHRSFWESLPESLSELRPSMLRSVRLSEKPAEKTNPLHMKSPGTRMSNLV